MFDECVLMKVCVRTGEADCSSALSLGDALTAFALSSLVSSHFSTGFIDKNNDLLYRHIKEVSRTGAGGLSRGRRGERRATRPGAPLNYLTLSGLSVNYTRAESSKLE